MPILKYQIVKRHYFHPLIGKPGVSRPGWIPTVYHHWTICTGSPLLCQVSGRSTVFTEMMGELTALNCHHTQHTALSHHNTNNILIFFCIHFLLTHLCAFVENSRPAIALRLCVDVCGVRGSGEAAAVSAKCRYLQGIYIYSSSDVRCCELCHRNSHIAP